MFSGAFVFILIVAQSVLTQSPTELSQCGEGEFPCRDGACIPSASRCNGRVDCRDRSDESFALCRNNTCEPSEFRCTYGACMPLAIRCDDKQDCADNSDELVPLCRNAFTEANSCEARRTEGGQWDRTVECLNSRWGCDDGQELLAPTRCDGRVDCADGSDETLARCADAECEAPLFQCAYGGCAYPGAQCDDVEDCADGSDESFELCGRKLQPVCTLPPHPRHGSYSTGNEAEGAPGDRLSSVLLQYSCEPPYRILGESTLFCSMGEWSGDFPKCVYYCELQKHPSVEYRCPLSLDGKVEGTRQCNDMEPAGTTVEPRCRQPVYYYPGLMLNMHCNDSGKWDQIVTCIPECGRLGSPADALLLQGREAKRNELPWHVAIYRGPKRNQMCAGTVVRNNVVISGRAVYSLAVHIREDEPNRLVRQVAYQQHVDEAIASASSPDGGKWMVELAAHCFWRKTKLLPPSQFVVAAGKLYRTWDHPKDDRTSQISAIREILVPSRFQGSATHFQDDIALLMLVSELQYTVHVRPACVDFDSAFDTRQLKGFRVGKIAGWGLTERGNYSETLRVADVPYVSIQDCVADTPEKFKAYLTSDKICAGYKDGIALCRGDSGGGLTFPARERGSYRYYLRGVASTAFNGQLCTSATISSFTHVVTHQLFLKKHL